MFYILAHRSVWQGHFPIEICSFQMTLVFVKVTRRCQHTRLGQRLCGIQRHSLNSLVLVCNRLEKKNVFLWKRSRIKRQAEIQCRQTLESSLRTSLPRVCFYLFQNVLISPIASHHPINCSYQGLFFSKVSWVLETATKMANLDPHTWKFFGNLYFFPLLSKLH